MQPYIQTTKYTCAAASLAMIINHFRPEFLLNAESEFDIWQKTATLPTRGSSIYGLASYAHNYGIPLKVIVGTHEYKFPGYKFKSYKKAEILVANFSSELFYKKAKEQGILMEERSITMADVDKELEAGKVLLLRLVIGIVRDSKFNRRNPHYLAVFGIKDGMYLVMDPKKGLLMAHRGLMVEAFEKVAELKRDNRMIVFG